MGRVIFIVHNNSKTTFQHLNNIITWFNRNRINSQAFNVHYHFT